MDVGRGCVGASAGALATTDEIATTGEVGYLHSFHAGSVVDGPGMRLVFWTTGCPLRCRYCHNPDTWRLRHGRQVTVGEVTAEVDRYAGLLRATRGGVTVSGGEPLVQAPFVLRVLRACHARGLHTALDTNGYLDERLSDADLKDIDLVLLDIKSWDPATHLHVTERPVAPVLRFARRLSDLGRPAWIRFVLVPGLTDDPANIDGLARFVATLGNVERVEVLPFHQMGRAKWEALGRSYTLGDIAPPAAASVRQAAEQFRAYGLPVP